MSNKFYMENMKTVYFIGNTLGLVAPINDDGFKGYKIYVILLILGLYAASIGSAYLKMIFDTTQKEISIYLNVIGQLLSTVMITITVYKCGFISLEDFNSLKGLFKEVDFGLKHNDTKAKPGKLYLVFKFIILLFIAFVITDIVFSAYSIELIVGNVIGKLCEVYFIVSILLIYNYVFLINTRLYIINQQIDVLLEKHKICISDFKVVAERNSFETSNMQEDLTKMRILFNSVLKIHSICNAAFGWNFMFIMFTIFIQLLQQINYLIIVILGTEKVKKINDPSIMLCYIAFGCLFLCIMGVVIAAICNTTTKEVKNTATICYNLLSDVPADSNVVQDRILREELILLAEHATNQCPQFSAAGFFNVNYSMLLGFLGTLTSYVIVLIQINT